MAERGLKLLIQISSQAENWYEMYHAVRIDRTEGTVFLDVDFDYGS